MRSQDKGRDDAVTAARAAEIPRFTVVGRVPVGGSRGLVTASAARRGQDIRAGAWASDGRHILDRLVGPHGVGPTET